MSNIIYCIEVVRTRPRFSIPRYAPEGMEQRNIDHGGYLKDLLPGNLTSIF
ncbi:MAG: hypothetical protein WKF89_20350 [Chitinophagaceae bacterium]